MGEEGIEHRLNQLEKESSERKDTERIMSDKIIEIEKISIAQTLILKIIMGSLKVISATFLAFVATNLFMYFNK